MPKASFASKDAYVPALGMLEGWAEITTANVKVHQYPPSGKTGEQFPPFLALYLEFQKTNEDGEPTEDEPLDKVLSIDRDLEKLRPGNAESRDDDDPEDLGDELDTEGNCIYAEDGAKINHNCGFMVFMRSLEEQGVKPEITGAGFAPDLVGLKGHFKTIKGEKINMKGREVEPTYFIADKITFRPYEQKAPKKGAGKAASAATTTTTSSAASGKANGAVKPAAAASNGNDPDAIATGIMTDLAKELAGETRDAKKLYAMAYSRLMKVKDRDKKLDKPVQDLLKSEDWLLEKAAELEFTYDDGVFTFAEAA